MPIEKKCPVCEKSFFVKPSAELTTYCCSNDCRNKRFKISLIGKNNPNYKNIPNKICLRCGSEYFSYNKTRKYCSTLCSNLSNRKNEDTTTREQKFIKNQTKEIKKYFCKKCNKNQMKFIHLKA